LIGARNKAAGEEAAAKLASEGIDARFIEIDVANYGSVEAAAGVIASGFGRLDILVNNAGINAPSTAPPLAAPIFSWRCPWS
jgi:NAD(P)-dependent dehydrogenase (short-subunit alcohol dehydrogenase family)